MALSNWTNSDPKMDKPIHTRRRLHWTTAATTLSLLTLHSLVDAAHAQMPTIVYPSGGGSHNEVASLQRGRDGLYLFNTAVNGRPVQMMFDTGASSVVLRAEDAEKVGISTNELTYSVTISTANGTARAAPVMIDTLSVGGITRHNVRAIVGRPGAVGNNLLGQTFLTRIAGFHREGDQIVLQGE
jgi:aspartyl protease family protein